MFEIQYNNIVIDNNKQNNNLQPVIIKYNNLINLNIDNKSFTNAFNNHFKCR